MRLGGTGTRSCRGCWRGFGAGTEGRLVRRRTLLTTRKTTDAEMHPQATRTDMPQRQTPSSRRQLRLPFVRRRKSRLRSTRSTASTHRCRPQRRDAQNVASSAKRSSRLSFPRFLLRRSSHLRIGRGHIPLYRPTRHLLLPSRPSGPYAPARLALLPPLLPRHQPTAPSRLCPLLRMPLSPPSRIPPTPAQHSIAPCTTPTCPPVPLVEPCAVRRSMSR
ncbi:hypothetical protein BJY59DRAFT_444442 [Rhodotorula toruloides]